MSNPSQLTSADLAALMCARLCHDLVSPVSAIGAALDVLEDPSADDMHDDALALIRGSANQAWGRLEYSRLAFGAGGSAPGTIDMAELKRVVEAMFANSKSRFVWKTRAAAQEKAAARVMLNLCLLAVEAMPWGGTATVEIDETGERITVRAEGKRARLEAGAEAALKGHAPEDGYDARSIQPYYAGLLAREFGGEVSAHAQEERVEFEAMVPPPAPPRAVA